MQVNRRKSDVFIEKKDINIYATKVINLAAVRLLILVAQG